MIDAGTLRWSDNFSRSTFGPAIWFDRAGFGSNIQGGIDVKTGGGMFCGSGSEIIFADGGSTYYSNYTFSDANRAGHRVYGWGTLRFLCHVNGLVPPSRRLAGEPFLPDPDLVVEAVVLQMAEMRETPRWVSGFWDIVTGKEPTPIHTLPPQARSFWEVLSRLHGLPTTEGVPDPD